MERIAYKIALDVTKAESQKFLTGFSVGETRARVLKITLNNGRNPVHFDGTETISMFVTKPSDTSPSIGLCYLEEDTIIYNVLQSDVSEEGPTRFTIKVQHLDEDQNISVLYAAHFTVQVTDPECDDSHVPDDPNYSILEALIAEVEQFDSDAEAFAIGTRGGVPVGPGDPAYENNAKFYAENLEVEVEEQVERAEAWATGTKGGVPVPETDPQHNNNAKYYAEQAEDSADNAAASALNAEASETNASNSATAAATSEANALSYKNAASGSATDANASALAAAASEANALSYKNAASGSATDASNSATAAATSEANALNSKNAASQSATDASGSATAASGSANAASGSANTASQKASDSEAWAEGTRGGVPVGPGDPTYEKNAKYWAEQASAGQIQADWNQNDPTEKDFIKNKPSLVKTLSGLTDTNISNPSNGQILKYNAATQKWENTNETVGIAPDNVSGIDVVPGDGTLTVKWSDPDDTVVEGQTICTWSKTKLVLKVGSYPSNEDDGTVVVTNSVRNQYAVNGYLITGLTNDTTYYLQLFPISDGNAVNRNSANRGSGTPAEIATITLTIVGAKEDTITIKNSDNETVGVCVFDTGAVSGTFTTTVLAGYSDVWTFESAKAKSFDNVNANYVKSATITSTAAQTVNVYEDGAIYWFGNDFGINWEVIAGSATMTVLTNEIQFTGTGTSWNVMMSLVTSNAVNGNGKTRIREMVQMTNLQAQTGQKYACSLNAIKPTNSYPSTGATAWKEESVTDENVHVISASFTGTQNYYATACCYRHYPTDVGHLYACVID